MVRNFHQGLDDSNKAISLNAKSARSYEVRGWLYQRMGQYQKAIDDCSRAIYFDSKLANAYSERVWSFEKLGKEALAQNDRQKFKELTQKGKRTSQLHH
jgi:tetratricopeptide (TPR) repeat protein